MEKYIQFVKEYNGFEGMNIKADYINIKTGELCLRTENYNPDVKAYTDGGKLKQFIFSVCLKEARVPATKESISNIGIMKGFISWLKIRGREGKFSLPGNSVAVDAISDVVTEKSDISCNIYSVKIRYLYYEN